MTNPLRSILQNSWLELASRWILGLTFLYASYDKILFPADFAKIIYGYALFPAPVINLIAIVLPFVELVGALALIAGVYPRSAAVIINALLVAFIILLSINLLRGHDFDCGCFAVRNPDTTGATKATLVRDFVYLALGLQVLYFRQTRRWSLQKSG